MSTLSTFGGMKNKLYLCRRMKQIVVKDSELSRAAMEGMDAFLQVFIDALRQAVGGEPTAETMQELNAD